MDDSSPDIDKTSASETKETELLSSQKEEESASEVQQSSPKSSDLSQGVEFSKWDDNSETASEQGSIKSVHYLQTIKESETSESENVISRSPSTIKTKMCEEPVSGAKRHKSDHSTSDREIEDKPRIPADPDCSGRTAVEGISLRPSTSAGGNPSDDSPELQGKSTNRSQKGPLICAQASDMDDQSPNARKKSVSANTEAFRFSSVKQDSATGMDSTIPTFSFSPATLFPDQEDIPYSCNYEDETESSLSASISMPQGDQEITAHSSCDENVRKEEIASGSSSSTDESGNLGCTSAQESSHKNVLDKA